ncbi:MAG TPA: AsmA-like C-terminal region-containing protein [Vicinamibacterales bacterium]|nr:AsmA-like C-terminal region-containing protein [Vicinamibacterales bacterium]
MRNRAIGVACGAVVLIAAGAAITIRQALASDLVRSEIEQQLATRLGQPVRIGSASPSIFPRIGVELRDVTIGAPASVHLRRLLVVTGARALFSRTVEDAELVLEDGRIAWPLPFPIGSTASTVAGGTPSFRIASVRRIQLRDITLATTLPAIAISLDASLDGDRLDVKRLTAQSGDTRLQAQGAIGSLARIEGRLNLKGVANVAGYAARDLAGTFTFTPQRFTLSPLSFSMFGGTFDGRLDADVRGTLPRLQLTGAVTRVDAAQVMKHTGAPGSVTGRLSGNITLSADGADGAALVRSARGTIRAAVQDGTLPYLDLVRPIVLAFGKPSGAPPEGSGSAFTRLAGAFALVNSVLTTDDLSLQSRDFDLAGRGHVRLDTGLVDARADAVLSRELTSQAGTDLRRYAQQDGRVVVPVTIAGTLDRPTVFVDVAAATRRAIGNELQRRASSLLERLVKKKKR